MASSRHHLSNRHTTPRIVILSSQLVKTAVLAITAVSLLQIETSAADDGVSSSSSQRHARNAVHSNTPTSFPALGVQHNNLTVIDSSVQSSERNPTSTIVATDPKVIYSNDYVTQQSVVNTCPKLLLKIYVSVNSTSTTREPIISTNFSVRDLSLSFVNALSRIHGTCQYQGDEMEEFTCGVMMNVTVPLENNELLLSAKHISGSVSFAGSIHAKALSLSNNKIQRIDSNVFDNFTSLQMLDLSNNMIRALDIVEGALQHLTILDASSNKLQRLDSKPLNLTFLNLRNNNLTDISFLSKFTRLGFLDLAHNRIPIIPESLRNLTNLVFLFLENNKISDVSFLPSLPTKMLCWISLSNNEIRKVDVSFTNHYQLKRLDLNNNNIYFVNISSFPKYIYELNLCNNKILNVTSYPFEGRYIQSLKMCNNSLTSAHFIMFADTLITLDLSNNNLTNIDKMFYKNDRLKHVRLENVNLKSLDFVSKLPALETLDVKENSLTELPKKIFEIKSLKELKISNNPLGKIYCSNDEDGNTIIPKCKIPHTRTSSNAFVIDIHMKSETVNDYMKCIFHSERGNAFWRECRTNNASSKMGLPLLFLIIFQVIVTYV